MFQGTRYSGIVQGNLEREKPESISPERKKKSNTTQLNQISKTIDNNKKVSRDSHKKRILVETESIKSTTSRE